MLECYLESLQLENFLFPEIIITNLEQIKDSLVVRNGHFT